MKTGFGKSLTSKKATDKRSKHGCFAFQDHGYAVWLKNVRFKNLDNSK
jgi:hypothetical protein